MFTAEVPQKKEHSHEWSKRLASLESWTVPLSGIKIIINKCNYKSVLFHAVTPDLPVSRAGISMWCEQVERAPPLFKGHEWWSRDKAVNGHEARALCKFIDLTSGKKKKRRNQCKRLNTSEKLAGFSSLHSISSAGNHGACCTPNNLYSLKSLSGLVLLHWQLKNLLH